MAGMLQMRRSRGAASGFLLVLLGAWGALIPFVGPYFHYAYTPDTAWNGTPLGWAEHYLDERKDADAQKRYGEIADYLRAQGPQTPA